MRRLLPTIAVTLLLAAAWPIEAQSWRGRGRLAGEVTDPDDQPVVGARVTLELDGEGPEPLTTNKKGKFSILGLARGDWQITIEAEGLMISKGTLTVSKTATGPARPVPIRMKWQQQIVAQLPAEDPDFSAVAVIEEGNRLLLERDYAAARAAYERALPHVVSQSRGSVLRGIASTWHGEGDDSQAISILERVVAEDPADSEAARMLVNLLIEANRDEEAREILERIPEGQKVDAATSLTLGIDLYNQGDLAGALAQFERVVRQHPDLADGYYYRGLVQLNQDDRTSARESFERFVELAPEHPRAEEARGFLDFLADS